jgi:hypothetical protein
MPRRITVPFVGGSAQARRVSVNTQRTVNFQVEKKGEGAKSPFILETIPGLTDRGVAGDGRLRTPQMPKWIDPAGNERLYGVWGTKLVSIDDTLTPTSVGTLNNSTGVARIARGRDFICIVDGDFGYTWDGTTFLEITDLDFPANFVPAGDVTHVVYLDGFFIINDASTDNFYISALEDPTSWNALDFDAASVAPDNALAIAASESILYIVGDETMEPYYNSGNADFPYELYLQSVAEYGILAPQSIAESDAGVFYIGTTPEGGRFVVRIQGTTSQIISEDEQENDLEALIQPETAYGYIYQIGTKAFYVMQLDPNIDSNSTLVYNIKAGTWENRAMQDGSAWRNAGHGVIGNFNVMGSRFEARMGTLDDEVFLDANDTLIRRRVTQIFHTDNMLMDWWQIVIDLDSGVGKAAGLDADTDPMIRLRYSDTNGESWSNILEAPVGKQGQFERRAVFNNLGQSRQRIWEIEYSADTSLTIINAHAVVEVLDD